MSKDNIILSNENVEKFKKLITFIPDSFGNVPLKILKTEDGICKASIETLDAGGNIAFSGNIILDNISELENGTMMVIRFPINKSVLNTIFNNNYDTIEINKTRILGKSKNKKLSVTMYQLQEKDIIELPDTNIEMFNLVTVNNSDIDSENYFTFNFSSEAIREFLDCINVLSPSDQDDLRFNFISDKNGNIIINAEDFLKNSFEYNLEQKCNNINAKYDNTLIKVLNKLNRFKDFDINMLISNPIIAFSLFDDELKITIGVPAQKD